MLQWKQVLCRAPKERSLAELDMLDMGCLSRVDNIVLVDRSLRRFVLQYASYAFLPAGETLFHQNDDADGVYIILHGCMRMSVDMSRIDVSTFDQSLLQQSTLVGGAGVLVSYGPLQCVCASSMDALLNKMVNDPDFDKAKPSEFTELERYVSQAVTSLGTGDAGSHRLRPIVEPRFFAEDDASPSGPSPCDGGGLVADAAEARERAAYERAMRKLTSICRAVIMGAGEQPDDEYGPRRAGRRRTRSVTQPLGARCDGGRAGGEENAGGDAVGMQHDSASDSDASNDASSPARKGDAILEADAALSPDMHIYMRLLQNVLRAESLSGRQLRIVGGKVLGTLQATVDADVHLMRIPTAVYLFMLARARREVHHIAEHVLSQTDIFKAWSTDDLQPLAHAAVRQTFRPGQQIISQGDPANGVHVVLMG
ncbi:cyclic nucleotide-binding domain-containing protein, partial [archaeon]